MLVTCDFCDVKAFYRKDEAAHNATCSGVVICDFCDTEMFRKDEAAHNRTCSGVEPYLRDRADRFRKENLQRRGNPLPPPIPRLEIGKQTRALRRDKLPRHLPIPQLPGPQLVGRMVDRRRLYRDSTVTVLTRLLQESGVAH